MENTLRYSSFCALPQTRIFNLPNFLNINVLHPTSGKLMLQTQSRGVGNMATTTLKFEIRVNNI
jgi:hypothetical protein